MNSILLQRPYSQDVFSILKPAIIQPFVRKSHPFSFCFVLLSVYIQLLIFHCASKLRSNGVQNIISDIFLSRLFFYL